MDNVDRMYRHLVRTIRSRFPQYLSQPFDVSELYQTILPYRHHRRELGVESNEDYEITLTELLSGARDYLIVDDRMSDVLRAELASVNPDPSAFKQFADSMVALAPAAVRSLEAGPADELSPPRASTAVPRVTPMPGFSPAASAAPAPVAAAPAPSAPPASAPVPPAPALPTSPASPAAMPGATSPTMPMSTAPASPPPAPIVPRAPMASPARESAERTPTSTAARRVSPPAGVRSSGPGVMAPGSGTITPEPGDTCPACDESLPAGRPITFCPHCGQNITTRNCPACGSELEVGWKFCPACGRPAAAH